MGMLEESGILDALIEMDDEEFLLMPEELKGLFMDETVLEQLPVELQEKIRRLMA